MSTTTLEVPSLEQAAKLARVKLDGTPNEEVVNQAKAFLAGANGNLPFHFDQYANLLIALEAKAEAEKAEAAKHQKAAKDAQFIADQLRAFMVEVFEERQIERLSLPSGRTLQLEENGGFPPVILDPAYEKDPSRLPSYYKNKKVIITPDKVAIRNSLLKGKVLDFAMLGERGKKVVIHN